MSEAGDRNADSSEARIRFPVLNPSDPHSILEQARSLKQQGNLFRQAKNPASTLLFVMSGVLYLEYSLSLERHSTLESASRSYQNVVAFMDDVSHSLPAVLASLCCRCKAIALARQSLLSISALKNQYRSLDKTSASASNAKLAKTMKMLDSMDKLAAAHKEWAKSVELLPVEARCSKRLAASIHDTSPDEVLEYAKELLERLS